LYLNNFRLSPFLKLGIYLHVSFSKSKHAFYKNKLYIS